MMRGKWIPQVKGDPNGRSWEISVVREDNRHGRISWGWFDAGKLLVSHNGGPCDWPLAPGLGPVMVAVACELADYLNEREAAGENAEVDVGPRFLAERP